MQYPLLRTQRANQAIMPVGLQSAFSVQFFSNSYSLQPSMHYSEAKCGILAHGLYLAPCHRTITKASGRLDEALFSSFYLRPYPQRRRSIDTIVYVTLHCYQHSLRHPPLFLRSCKYLNPPSFLSRFALFLFLSCSL